jgi:hypothetical protein
MEQKVEAPQPTLVTGPPGGGVYGTWKCRALTKECEPQRVALDEACKLVGLLTWDECLAKDWSVGEIMPAPTR